MPNANLSYDLYYKFIKVTINDRLFCLSTKFAMIIKNLARFSYQLCGTTQYHEKISSKA
jgi:hypothetical protein